MQAPCIRSLSRAALSHVLLQQSGSNVTCLSQSNLVQTYCDGGRNYKILENLLLSMDVQVSRTCPLIL